MNQTANYALLLKSKDPKERYKAVKEIARAKDESMLKKLSELASRDPDEQVRMVAAKAQQYISSGNVEAVSAAPARKVSKEDEQRAKDYVNEALGYQMKGERNKALKALGKAVDLNPAVERDSYFISVLHATTGAEGDQAMALMRDKAQIKQIGVTEKQLAREKRMQDHIKDTEKSSWSSAMMDLAIFAGILIVGTILAVMAIGQSAEGLLTGYRASVDAYYDAVDAGQKDAKYPDPVDPELWSQAEDLRTVGMTTALIAGLIVSVSTIFSTVIQLAVTHAVARFVFKGVGTLPHLIYKVVSFYNGRMPVLFVIILAGIILTFSGGGTSTMNIFSGIVGLFSLFLSFKTIARVTETYDFGMARGCMSVIGGSIILSIIGVVAQMLLLTTISAAIMGSIGA